MTPAYRLKGLGWFGGCVAVTLGFYLVSLQVAAERKHLDQVNGKIASAERDIRALETEFDTRANLAQLERWNGDTLALVAPTAGQFVRDEGQLAAISFNGAQPGGPEVQTAALVVPSYTAQLQPAVVTQPAATPAAATMVQVAAKAPAPAPLPRVTQVAAVTPLAATQPRFIKASAMMPLAAARTNFVKAVAIAKAASPAALRKAQAVAMLDQSLLSDATLGDLLKGARNEGGSRR